MAQHRILARTRAPLLLALALSLLPLAACSGATEVRLSADHETISAGGIEAATITAEALVAGDPAKAGTTISFETTNGSFESGSSVTSATRAADGAGRAQVKLYSAATQGSATVTASFDDAETGLGATSSITITFGPPSAASSPVDGTFRMTCDAVNVGALREPVPDVQVTCALTALTRAGQSIKAAAMSPTFMLEAGSLTPHEDSYSGERVYLYSPRGGVSTPLDVTPDSSVGEPSYTDGNGRQRNPRDGLVTLVAVVDGEEAFTDTNGNGQYDQGELFGDAAEPFLDVNDNDTWDSGEKYVDTNSNGKWDKANGQWDGSTKVMAIYKLLWTGPLDATAKTSRIESVGTQIAKGGKLELTAYALDANLNPIAAFQKNSDALEWTLTTTGDAVTHNELSPPMDNVLGFSFDKAASTERKRWKILSKSFVSPAFKITLEDDDPTESAAPVAFTLSAKTVASPGPSGDGSFLDQVTETLGKVQGTCD